MDKNKQHIFLVGAKSLGTYGGYETFVNKLTEYHQNDETLIYHVACKANGDGYMDETKLLGVSNIKKNDQGETVEFTYHNARCFKIHVPNIGPAQAIYYDVVALNACCKYIETHHIEHPIVYIMACRIGPFASYFYKKIHRLGGRVYLNPDGHEWMRSKWSVPVRKYWKISEQSMIKYCDLAICDSVNIEKYIHESYDGKGRHHQDPKTTFIAYGAETKKCSLADDDPDVLEWYQSHQLKPHEYYLIVGRFVPENNFETMIREFMKSSSNKDLAIITTANEAFLEQLEEKLHFKQDKRIKFVGTVYNQPLLKKIRENAYGYFHGHEVGGTNPSLLEALGSTSLNLLLDVGFNEEVGQDAALYWNKSEGSLARLINEADKMDEEHIAPLSRKAKKRIESAYSWEYIASQYKRIFMK
jgi:rhamnosyltransferase